MHTPTQKQRITTHHAYTNTKEANIRHFAPGLGTTHCLDWISIAINKPDLHVKHFVEVLGVFLFQFDTLSSDSGEASPVSGPDGYYED